jgi:glycosyltransferase involved in cell wall biosynthesis
VAFAGLVVQLARATARVAREIQADLVHAHWWVPGGIAARIARPRTHRPYVVTLHGTDVALLAGHPEGRWAARRVLRAAARVTAVSSHLADGAARYAGVTRERIRVTPMPIDTDRFSRPSGGGGGIVTVGRLTRQKRIGLLVDAVALLAADGLVLPLTVVGEGPERPELERLVRGRGLTDRVHFTGSVDPEHVPDVLGNADVFAFPAVGEGLGLAAAEALLLGIPVVAALDGGGVVDLVPPDGAGRLVAPNAAAFAAGIRALLDDPRSRSAAAMAGAALRTRFDPDTVARVFEGIYEGARARGAAAVA